MNSAARNGLLGAVMVLLLAGPVDAADPLLEGRLSRVERILENQSGSQLVLQMQQLQTEMQQLRGMLETQTLEIEQLKRQQQAQYLDLESRLKADAVDLNRPSLVPGTADSTRLPGDAVAPARPLTEGGNPSGIPFLPSPETQQGNARDAYGAAFGLLKEQQYDQAITAFKALLRQYPQSDFSARAHYWLGETYYLQRQYAAALTEFDRLVQNFSASDKVPGALLKIATIQFEQRDLAAARKTFQQLIGQYPNSTEARQARAQVERIVGGMP